MNDIVDRGLTTHLNRFDARTQGATARLGWKVAFNVRPVQERLGLSGSLVAGLTRATLHDGARPYSLAGATRPALEAEVAVWLGRNIAAEDPEEQVAAAIAAWAPAIELVDFDRPFDELETILAEASSTARSCSARARPSPRTRISPAIASTSSTAVESCATSMPARPPGTHPRCSRISRACSRHTGTSWPRATSSSSAR